MPDSTTIKGRPDIALNWEMSVRKMVCNVVAHVLANGMTKIATCCALFTLVFLNPVSGAPPDSDLTRACAVRNEFLFKKYAQKMAVNHYLELLKMKSPDLILLGEIHFTIPRQSYSSFISQLKKTFPDLDCAFIEFSAEQTFRKEDWNSIIAELNRISSHEKRDIPQDLLEKFGPKAGPYSSWPTTELTLLGIKQFWINKEVSRGEPEYFLKRDQFMKDRILRLMASQCRRAVSINGAAHIASPGFLPKLLRSEGVSLETILMQNVGTTRPEDDDNMEPVDYTWNWLRKDLVMEPKPHWKVASVCEESPGIKGENFVFNPGRQGQGIRVDSPLGGNVTPVYFDVDAVLAVGCRTLDRQSCDPLFQPFSTRNSK